MTESYIPIEDAARFEGLSYVGMTSRLKRNPGEFKVKREARTDGGKPLVLVAVSSLSTKARKAWRATQKVAGGEETMEQSGKSPPWYVGTELGSYLRGREQEYQQAQGMAREVETFLRYPASERTAYAETYAMGLGISTRSLYRYAESVLEATVWARRLEDRDGHSRDHFKTLALCRKPREGGTFPSLSEEQRALVENIWFDKRLAANRPKVELAYTLFQEEAARRGWGDLPSCKTVGRYIHHIMSLPGAESARYLSASGARAWKNKYMVKAERDSSSLKVLECVVADAHTFDLWVKYTMPNGKIKAIKPVLVAWLDVRSRSILGAVICEHSNTQVVKESFLKLCYTAGVPEHIHTDNGKDFANRATLGQDRKVRHQEREVVEMDSETMGFYLSMGGKEWSRSLPYQPWVKDIERPFGTICEQFSKRFASYTGTLTGSKTEGKVRKDIDGMLARGELLTMEEFFVRFEQYMEKYHHNIHRGLKRMGEKWTRPGELFECAERYEKAAPPREFAAMLLMKAETALVTNQGIRRFNTLYSAEELGLYVNQKVGIKWSPDDKSVLYIYDQDGSKICEARPAERLGYLHHCDQEALEEHLRRQKRQQRTVRELAEEMETPFEQRIAESRDPGIVGKLDLTIGHASKQKVVSLPTDKEYRGEVAARRQKGAQDTAFFEAQAEDALSKLRAMG